MLTSLSSGPSVSTIVRRAPNITSPKLNVIIDEDNSTWSSKLKELRPVPSILFSALGSTRAQAGSFEAQRKIDVDLNLALARAAKEAGVKVYVLISSAGISKTSVFPYSRMKAELEEAVVEIGFDQTVIVNPGMLLGDRERKEFFEVVLRNVATVMGKLHGGLKDFWAQDGDVIARATVSAALAASEGKAPDKVWRITQSDIVRMGRTEWKEGAL